MIMKNNAQGSIDLGVSFQAKLAPDGTPFIQGLLKGNLPEGIEIIGNGTCPHPLSVKLTGAYAIVPQLLKAARQQLALYKSMKHIEGDEKFTDFNEKELAADMSHLEQLLASITTPQPSPAEVILAELVAADLLICSCADECEGTCLHSQAVKLIGK